MGQGLRIWDENGVNLVDTDYRMTQIIGSVYTAELTANSAYVNGNIYVPEFSQLAGTPFVLNIPNDHHFDTRTQIIHGNGSNLLGTYHRRAEFARIEGNYVKWKYDNYSGLNPGHSSNKNGRVEFFNLASWIIWGVY